MWPESVSKVLHNLYKKFSESHDLKPTKSHKIFSNFTSIDIRALIKCPPHKEKKSTPLIEPSLFWKTKSTGRQRWRGSAGRSKNFVVASSCLLLAHGRWPRFRIFVWVCIFLFCICIYICILFCIFVFCICIWDFLWLPAVCSSVTAADPGFVDFADLCSLGQLPVGRSGDNFSDWGMVLE